MKANCTDQHCPQGKLRRCSKITFKIAARILLLSATLFLCFGPEAIGQVRLLGLTQEGGLGAGAVVGIKPDGSDFAAVPFQVDNPGASPYFGRLLAASNGHLYGMAHAGGSSGCGVIFQFDPAGSSIFTVKHHFDRVNGAVPYGTLTEYNGKFYGMTSEGGNSNKGVIFEYDPAGAGTYTVKYHFTGVDGGYPTGDLIEYAGKFYGLTPAGGNTDQGVIFEYDPTGVGGYSVLHHFDNPNGAAPNGSLLESGGKFYGMTRMGGSTGTGVIFEYNPAIPGSYAVIHDFGGTLGANPYGNLIVSGGKFYGLTIYGGSFGRGSIFEYNPAGAGTFSVLHDFDEATGDYPFGDLLESGGKFYGTTIIGGDYNYGVVFEYDPAGAGNYTVLHHFNGLDGGNSQSSLIAWDGKFYGMTNWGGPSSNGVIFEYDPAGGGTYVVKVNLNTVLKGAYPTGSLLRSGNTYYGMANRGGNSNSGTLFAYDPGGGGGFDIKHHFDLTNGGFPTGSLIKSGDYFYGMTNAGGIAHCGVIFRYDPAGAGTYSVLHEFDDTNGGFPFGDLLEYNGKFYGLTTGGGSSNGGVLFEYDPVVPGSYVIKFNFDDTIGSNPYGSLCEYNGQFYGMTSRGGSAGAGVIFVYDPAGSGNYAVRHEFNYTDGATPYGSLIESGGKLYGATSAGGSQDAGVIFQYEPSGGGSYTVLHQFDGQNGGVPQGSLAQSGNQLFGMASRGGSSNAGVIFKYGPLGAGNYSVLKNLGAFDGANPIYGHLIPTLDCPLPPVPADTDCDGIDNACDECPGGDDLIDNNNDGLPDCKHPPAFYKIIQAWKCGSNHEKVSVCHKGKNTLCVNYSALASHLAHGDYLGSCNGAACEAGNQSKAPGFIGPQPHIAPNPATTETWVSLSYDETHSYIIRLLDIQGKVLDQFDIAGGNEPARLDLSRLGAGLYFVQVFNEAIIFDTMKLIVSKR